MMMMRCAFPVALLCALFAGCGSDGGGNGGDDIDGASPEIEPVSITIEPQDPTVTVQNGAGGTVEFRAFVVYEDGSEGYADASWSLDRRELGIVEAATGAFSASGGAAGIGTVQASVGDVRATTSVSVVIDNTVLGEGVPADGPGRFSDDPVVGAPTSPSLLYPLDGAVMPATVAAPLAQWENGAVGDLYRVVITAGLATLTAYSAHVDATFNLAQTIDDATWDMLIASAGAGPITFVVDRWSSADETTSRSNTVAITVVDANVLGAIYYWDLSDGKILRITEEGRDVVIENPPPQGGSECIACHTVSRDGRYMAVEMYGGNNFSAVYDLTDDLTQDPAPTVVPPTVYKALFQAFNPEGTRLVTAEGQNTPGSRMAIRDPATGAAVTTTGTPLPASNVGHVAWSPDGSLIAYIANTNGAWAVDFTLGDLAVIPVTGPDAFGPSQTLVPAGGKANSWPSFSPDSQWIAYGRGANSRGRNVDTIYPGSLFLIARDGGTPVELAAATGGLQNSHLPNFSPFKSGGYYWLLFYSIRDYGNAQAGTKGTGRRQMWVTAIDATPEPGQDPSHVPYWLPGQDVATDNMSGFWALAPPPE